MADLPDEVVSKALGNELRLAREQYGLTRLRLVERLPSRIGDRTLASYERGTRHPTVLRFIEICHGIGLDPGLMLSRALQRARIHVATINLQLDLHELLRDCATSRKFRSMAPWVRNTLQQNPSGIVEVQPVVVRNLAAFVGSTASDLADYFAGFVPDYDSEFNRRVKPMKQLQTRVTLPMGQQIDAIIEKVGGSLSDTLRKLLRDGLNAKIVPEPSPGPYRTPYNVYVEDDLWDKVDQFGDTNGMAQAPAVRELLNRALAARAETADQPTAGGDRV